MASSLPCNIPVVMEYIAKNIFSKINQGIDLKTIEEGKPLPAPDFKILDVGAGFGKWGFLARDTFDVMMFHNFKKEDWKLDITAIEPFENCIGSIQEEIYNRIIKKDFSECIDELGQFDLAILGDMIEHFDKETGHKVLEKLFWHTENIIVSTPNGYLPQGAWANNELEVHKSGWEIDDFMGYNVKDYRVVEDTIFKDVIANSSSIPEDKKQPISMLVAWLQK